MALQTNTIGLDKAKFPCALASAQSTRPSTFTTIVPNDDVPSTRLEDLPTSHHFLLPGGPETLARDVHRSRGDLRPRVQLLSLVVVVAPPDGRAPLAADPAAVSGAGRQGRFSREVGEVVDAVEGDRVRGGVPPLGADVAVAAVARDVGHRVEGVVGVWKGRSGFGGLVLVQEIIVVGIDVGELLVDLLDGAVEENG